MQYAELSKLKSPEDLRAHKERIREFIERMTTQMADVLYVNRPLVKRKTLGPMHRPRQNVAGNLTPLLSSSFCHRKDPPKFWFIGHCFRLSAAQCWSGLHGIRCGILSGGRVW